MLEDCAERGCAGAMYSLSTLYLDANEVDYDIEKIIAYLTMAASCPGIAFDGDPVEFRPCTDLGEFVERAEAETIAYAQEYLAYLYSGEADDVPRDAHLVAKWAAKAVMNSFHELTWPLIAVYVEIGNLSGAKKLLRKLVQENNHRAMYELALLYEKSDAREEQDQVYRLKIEARKGGYPRNVPPAPFPPPSRPERPHRIIEDFAYDDEWPKLLAEADACQVNDPHELRVKVRAYYKLAKSKCPEAAVKLVELRALIGDSMYREIMKY